MQERADIHENQWGSHTPPEDVSFPSSKKYAHDSTLGNGTTLHDISLESADSKDTAWTPSGQVQLVIAGQAFCIFCISLDLSILTTTLPTVAQALGAHATKAFWIAASFLLANAVVQPVTAALADIFGRRSIYFLSLAFFTVGSIVCATAPNVAAMLAGRTIQGMGAGGITAVNLIITSDLVPLRQRSKYLGIMQLVLALGTNTAPIIGGALIKVSWRWLFWINLPFCGIGLAIIPFFLRYERPATTVYDKLSSVDWIGSAMIIVSSTLFLVGISWGGNQYEWRSAAVIVPIIAGVIGMALTVFYEWNFAKLPFLQLALFQTRSQTATYVCTVLQAFVLFALTYYLVLYLLACKLYSPVIAGLALFPFAMTVVPVSGITGVVIARIGHYKWAIWLGWALSVIGVALLVVLEVDTSPAAWVFIFMCAGAGQGLLLIAHSVAVQASCKPEDAAHASGMYCFMRAFGLCLGVIVGGTIFQNFFRMRVIYEGLPPEYATNAEGLVPLLRAISGVSPLKAQLQHVYAWALRMLFATLTGISALGFLVSIAIEGHTLDTALESKHVLKSARVSRELLNEK